MRLIDADYLKSILNSGGGETVDINISKSMPLGEIVDTVIQAYRKCLFAELEKVPTAYDVDKVVRRFKEEKNSIYREDESLMGERMYIGIDKAIEIVQEVE